MEATDLDRLIEHRARQAAQGEAGGPPGGGMNLQRLVIDYRSEAGEELVVRCLYRTQSFSNPGTKARAGEVTALVRTGLEQALKALEGDAAVAKLVGTSGFTTREDVLLATTSRDAAKLVKGEA